MIRAGAPLALALLVGACGGARTAGLDWPVRHVRVSGVAPGAAPEAARRFFEEVTAEMLFARGYRPASDASDEARLLVELQDWEVGEEGQVRVVARFALQPASGGAALWSATVRAEARPVPAIRTPAEFPVRRPPWEVVAERAARAAFDGLAQGPGGGTGEGER